MDYRPNAPGQHESQPEEHIPPTNTTGPPTPPTPPTTHILDEINVAEHAFQFNVTTTDQTFSIRHVSLAANAWQVNGRMNDESIQAVLRVKDNHLGSAADSKPDTTGRTHTNPGQMVGTIKGQTPRGL